MTTTELPPRQIINGWTVIPSIWGGKMIYTVRAFDAGGVCIFGESVGAHLPTAETFCRMNRCPNTLQEALLFAETLNRQRQQEVERLIRAQGA